MSNGKGLAGLSVWQRSIELAEKIHEEFNIYTDPVDEIRRMIAGYITYLKKNKIGKDEPGSGIYEPTAEYILEPDESDET
ncbi:MAG: hypothetical protein JW757_00580 [Anaerolineales bacterium]|nr:hypothetical protein [Anaerolineales bacterium]